MKLTSRTRLSIAILFIAAYMFSAFLWWTYSLLDYTKKEYHTSTKMHQADSINLAGEIIHNIISRKFTDSLPQLNTISTTYKGEKLSFNPVNLKKNAEAKYPSFDIAFSSNDDPHLCYKVSLRKEALRRLKSQYARSRAGWIGESATFLIVMILICVLAFIYLDRILRLKQQQNNFLLAITHELKTPIAATTLAIQTAKKTKPENTDLMSNLLGKADKNMRRLSDLIDDVLMVSRIDSIRINLQKSVVPVIDLVQDSLDELTPSLPAEQKFIQEINPGMVLKGDYDMLKITIKNLITNAVKYTNDAQKPIEIRAYYEKNNPIISIADQGPGIPDNEKRKIFRKFYRIGDEHTRSTTGTGLGLYLVHKIIRQHNAIIYVQDNKPTGSLFKIVFKSRATEI